MTDTREDESALLRRARARDQEAFGRLVTRYEHSLLAVLQPIVGDRERARDLVQETMLRAYQHLDQYVEEHRFSTWLFRIGVNLAISSRRRSRLEDRVSEESRATPGSGIDPAPTALEQLARREEAEAVAEAISRLPPRYAEVVRLRFHEGESCAAIAKRLGTTANSVSLILFRAKQRLREELNP